MTQNPHEENPVESTGKPTKSDTGWKPANPGDTPGELVPGEADEPEQIDLSKETDPQTFPKVFRARQTF